MADDLIQEMEDEERLLRLRAMMVRIGCVLGAVVVCAAVGVGVWGWQQHSLHKAQAAASDRYFEAMRLLGGQGGTSVATGEARQKVESIFADLAQSAPSGVRGYAAMYLADMKHQDHDVSAAVKLWQGVADDKSADSSVRSMARFLGLNARMDTAPVGELRQGYQGVIQGGGSWVPLGKEGLVALDLRAGSTEADHAEARRLLQQIQVSPDSTDGLRQRAGMLLQTLGDAG